MVVHKSNHLGELSNEQIRKLVQSLQSLREGELGVALLVACGPRAIEPLHDFLLKGKPASIFEPRQRAVRALAALGAKDVLLQYLRDPKQIADPVIRLGEEAVENTAARALSQWHSEDIFWELLYLAEQRSLSGVVEALGTFLRSEAVPCFVRALGDDVSYRVAEDALRALGNSAWAALIDAARTPDPSRQFEAPSSRLRRLRALRLLANAGLQSENWPALEALIFEPDHELAATAARIALQIAPEEVRATAVRRLFEALNSADWFLQGEIEDSLCEHYAKIKEEIRSEIERRKCSSQQPVPDPALMLLTAVEHRIVQPNTEEAPNRRREHEVR